MKLGVMKKTASVGLTHLQRLVPMRGVERSFSVSMSKDEEKKGKKVKVYNN